MNCSEAKFYENYSTSDSHTLVCYFKMCLPTRHQNGVGNRVKVYTVVPITEPTLYNRIRVINQACVLDGGILAKICFAFLWTETKSKSINTQTTRWYIKKKKSRDGRADPTFYPSTTV